MNATTTLVRRDYEGLTMAVSPAESMQRVRELQAFVQQVMVKDVDYGTIPGTEKNTLLQPGAQKLCEIYGFYPTFEDVETTQRWDDAPFFLFRKRCVLRSRRDDSIVGDGIGSCNSRESRYAYRWLFDNEVPKEVDKRTLVSRTFHSAKKNRDYTKYRQPNEDICSLANTIEKMACKRAHVHAVIGATRSAGMFMQDVEDLPAEVFGSVGAARTWEGEDDEPEVAPALRNQPPPAAKESEASATLPVSPPPKPAAAAAPPPAPSPASSATSLTCESFLEELAQVTDKPGLARTKKLLEQLTTQKVGDVAGRNRCTRAWTEARARILEGVVP